MERKFQQGNYLTNNSIFGGRFRIDVSDEEDFWRRGKFVLRSTPVLIGQTYLYTKEHKIVCSLHTYFHLGTYLYFCISCLPQKIIIGTFSPIHDQNDYLIKIDT